MVQVAVLGDMRDHADGVRLSEWTIEQIGQLDLVRNGQQGLRELCGISVWVHE